MSRFRIWRLLLTSSLDWRVARLYPSSSSVVKFTLPSTDNSCPWCRSWKVCYLNLLGEMAHICNSGSCPRRSCYGVMRMHWEPDLKNWFYVTGNARVESRLAGNAHKGRDLKLGFSPIGQWYSETNQSLSVCSMPHKLLIWTTRNCLSLGASLILIPFVQIIFLPYSYGY